MLQQLHLESIIECLKRIGPDKLYQGLLYYLLYNGSVVFHLISQLLDSPFLSEDKECP